MTHTAQMETNFPYGFEDTDIKVAESNHPSSVSVASRERADESETEKAQEDDLVTASSEELFADL